MTAAPRVDAALAGRIGWRDETRTYLRGIERDARALRDEVAAVLSGGGQDAVLVEAAGALDRFLGDPLRSPLMRALLRSPRDLEPGAAGRRSLDARWAQLERRAHGALERHEHASALRKGLARLGTRFGPRLPWHLAQALQRARISEADADRPDRASLAARVQRLKRIEQELEEVSDTLPQRVEQALEETGWPAGVSAEELAAATETVMGDGWSARAEWRRRTRALAGSHRARLLGSGGSPSSRDPAEAAAREVVSLVEAGMHPGAEDVDAWGLTLRAAARDRSPTGGPADPAASDSGGMGSLLFVLPLFDRFVLVCTGRPWPARVDGRGVRCGVSARVVAALPPGWTGTAVEADLWAAPLFDLPHDAAASWLITARPAEITPFARIAQDRWLATVERRGELASSGDAAWKPMSRQRPAVRLLPEVDHVPAEGTLQPGPPSGTDASWFGWRTSTVPVAVADQRSIWLRSATTPAGLDHLQAEQAFFQAAGLRLPGLAPRCLGRADDRGEGYLYAPPLAFRTADSASLRAWERDDPLAFVTAAARLWQALSLQGLGFGFYHADTLGFRALFGPRGPAGSRLQAVALAAPLGTRLGSAYRRSRESLRLFPPYERVGLRLPPSHLDGEVSLPETEATAFALYALDRLLVAPVDIPAGAPWDEFVDMLASQSPLGVALGTRVVRALKEGGAATVAMMEQFSRAAEDVNPMNVA